ncbi:MAG: dihydrolipoamide acetyltransferase [Armatimonadaceae bacterium]
MATVLKMPVLGNSVEEVRIVEWVKQEGDTIQAGEKIAEVETDKTNVDFEAQEGGVIRRILAAVDTYVKVEAPVVIVGTADEPIDHLLAGDNSSAAPAAPAGNGSAAPVVSAQPAPVVAPPALAASDTLPALSPRARRAADMYGVDVRLLAGRGTGPQGRVQEKDVLALRDELAAQSVAAEITERLPRVSPLARAVADGEGVNLSAVSGTGSGGRITANDVRSAAATPAPAAVPAAPPVSEGGKRTITLTGLRKRVADNLMRSVRNAPHVTLNLSADMTEAMRLRKQLLPAIEAATGVRVSPTDIIVKACAVALREFAYVNAHIDGDTITLFDEVHIGLAVSLGEAGLIVPVIKNAHRKGLAELAGDRNDLANRARANQLKSDDITGGTFTVTNLGNYGIEYFNPIIPPPQVAILGVGAITDTVVARDGQPTVRPMMGLSLSFDHRAIDGAPAAAFLARIKEILESPFLLLL